MPHRHHSTVVAPWSPSTRGVLARPGVLTRVNMSGSSFQTSAARASKSPGESTAAASFYAAVAALSRIVWGCPALPPGLIYF